MLLGVEKRKKEEEELDAKFALRSEVAETEDRGVSTSEACKDVYIVTSLRDCSTLSEMTSSHWSSAFEFHKADRALHRTAIVPPFSKPAPSKWDDGQKWIVSPTSNRPTKVGAHSKKTAFLGCGNKQPAIKVVLEVTEEADTKRIDQSQVKKEVRGQKTLKWAADPYPVTDLYSKAPLVQNSVADSVISLSRHDSLTSVQRSTTIITPPSTGRPVSMRDMGTEMTPIASQEPSRNETPVRATTPMQSPTSSHPSTPGRTAPSSTPVEPVVYQEDPSRKGLSEKELQMKTRTAIMTLGTQLGKMNIAAWASKKEEDKDTSVSLKCVPVEQPTKIVVDIRAAAWEEAEKAKYLARFKREEIKIQAWENHQKAKTEAQMRKIEVEVERMRACAHDRLMNKLAAARHKAEEKCTAAETQRNQQAAKTEQQVGYIRRTGCIPSSFSCWSWCSWNPKCLPLKRFAHASMMM